MRWRGMRKSSNVEDHRTVRVSGGAPVGGSGMSQLLSMMVRFLGFKGTLILVVCVFLFGLETGTLDNMLTILGLQQGPPTRTTQEPFQETPAEKELVDFVSVVLADTEETWDELFRQRGLTYQEPRLVLFRDAVKSACGMGRSAIGDDTLQRQSQGYVSPDSFTHGTSEQRVKWFKIGLNCGEIGCCNTFEDE